MPKSYSGSTNFTFEIERFQNLETKEYFLYDEVPKEDIDNEELYEYSVIELKVYGNGHHYPGKYYGPWEDSYPDDTECEIESITDSKNNNWLGKLTDSEMSSIEESLMENIKDSSDHYDDRDYDDRDYYDY